MATYDLFTEKLLLKQISEGNEEAFRKVFNLYSGHIFTFVERFTHSAADAEEIVQDTFMILWKQRAQMAAVDHPRNYIYTVARNHTFQFLKLASRNQKMLDSIYANMSVHAPSIQDDLDARECEELINQSLAGLSPLKQQIFKLSRMEGYSHEKIAEITGLSKSRVKNIIVEILKYIRFILSKQVISLVMFSKIQDLYHLF